MGVRVGFRAGPVSVGSTLRTKDAVVFSQVMVGLMALSVMMIPVLIAIFAIIWPYRLGLSIAAEHGAGHGAQVAIAWSLEGIYLAGLFIVGIVVLVKVGTRMEAKEQHQRAAARVAELSSTSDSLIHRASQFVAAAMVIDNFVELMQAAPAGLEASQVAEWDELASAGFELATGERLLGALPVGLSVPRVAVRNGPKMQTTVALGEVIVTNKQLRFLSTERTETWRVCAITGVVHDGFRILLPVSTRRTVYGLDTSMEDPTGSAAHLLVALVGWARGLPSAPIEQVAQLAVLRDDCRAQAAQLDRQILGLEGDLQEAKIALGLR